MENKYGKFRKCYYIWVLVIIAVLVVCIILCGAEAEEDEEDNRQMIYSVLVEGDPLAFRHPSTFRSKAVRDEAKKMEEFHEEILAKTLENGSYTKLYSYKHIINAFAIHTSPSQAKKLKRAKGVKEVEEDRGVRVMTTYTPEFLELPQHVWTQISGGDRHAGEDVVIGFVDTGINPSHPSFGFDLTNPYSSNLSRFSGVCETGPLFPVGSCNGKIISARFFSAGASPPAVLNASVDILSPFDASGHGSHVASIAAGNAGVPVIVDGFFYGRASGMAPRSRIAVYKAIYPTIGTLADVIAAIDQAIMDGVDVLTLSVGPDEPPEDKPTVLGMFDVAMLLARKAGVFVVQAAGNHGPSPSSVVSYSPWVVGAAAGSTDRSYPSSLFLAGGQNVGGIGLSGPTFGAGLLQHKLVLAKDAMRRNMSFLGTEASVEECQSPEALEPAIVFGSIVICTFSDGFYNQTSSLLNLLSTAASLRFSGFAFVANPRFGDFVAEPVIFPLPGILIPKVSDSQIVMRYYEDKTYRDKRGTVTEFGGRARIGEGRIAELVGKAPAVSRFSSRGPDFIDVNRKVLDVLKPDVLAPGHQIWGAWTPPSAFDPILTGRSFALLSGTSMAAPHIAGIAALIKQMNPTWTPAMIASAISTTASAVDSSGEVIAAESYDVYGLFPSNHFDRGAGHVNPGRAMDPGLVLPAGFEDYINFLCSIPDINRDMVRASIGMWCTTTTLSHPANLNLPSITISTLKGSLMLRRSFQNVANKTETYICSVFPPNGTTVRLSPPWFTIPVQGKQDLDIEFNVTEVQNQFTFGEIVLTGSLNHIVRLPLSVKTVPIV
ncbi:PREDICTED: subtilisin-like protease SBT2.4 [Tarenaya hassleriana]|uniref:subtilisin-like protease SBT2.4 n=1 Tax=Tarenaya hassleriana TaxID=28532 RepID=UPI00053C1F0D|nr:PREDICTED: subtilisin-like protease SBT2.4 [Tarenaya hassleriana]